MRHYSVATRRFLVLLTVLIGAFLASACYTGEEDKEMADRGYRGYHSDGIDPNAPKVGDTRSNQGWSAFGTLTTQNVDREVSLQQIFDKAGTYTVQFDIRPSASRTVPIEPEATIEWSVAGNKQVRKITPSSGTSISGTAEGIRVTVKDKTATVPATPESYDVFLTVSPGMRPLSAMPPLLRPAAPNTFGIAVVAGGFVKIPIPDNAGINAVMATVRSNTSVPIAEYGARLTVSDNTSGTVFVVTDVRAYQWYPIPAGANIVTISNDTAVDQTWTVTFGIDG